MNSECIQWVRNHLVVDEVRDKRVLEVGSYNVNGSIRPVIMDWQPSQYIGLDLRPGPCVDYALDLIEAYETDICTAAAFDLVLALSMLEHCKDLRRTVDLMQLVCKPGGFIMVAAPRRWHRHGHPDDFWRFTAASMEALFHWCVPETIQAGGRDHHHETIYAKFRRPERLKHSHIPLLITVMD